MFAIITPALITGSTADRWKFGAFVVFITIWAIVVYAPVAHWVFSPTGWLFKRGAEDFAGGTVVHANAGAAAMAVATRARQAPRLAGRQLPAAQRAVRPARCRPAVVRLVRLQRRFRTRRQQPRGRRLRQHQHRHRGRHARPGWSSRRSATATPPRWVPLPVPSPAWSPSPRLVASSARSGSIFLGVIAGAVCALCTTHQGQGRHRRLARRRRGPPRRRCARRPAHRLLGHQGHRRHATVVFYGGGFKLLGKQALAVVVRGCVHLHRLLRSSPTSSTW